MCRALVHLLLTVPWCIACQPLGAVELSIEGNFSVPDEVDRVLVQLRSDAHNFQTSHLLTQVDDHMEETLTIWEGELIRGEIEVIVDAHLDDLWVAHGTTKFAFHDVTEITCQLQAIAADDTRAVALSRPASTLSGRP